MKIHIVNIGLCALDRMSASGNACCLLFLLLCSFFFSSSLAFYLLARFFFCCTQKERIKKNSIISVHCRSVWNTCTRFHLNLCSCFFLISALSRIFISVRLFDGPLVKLLINNERCNIWCIVWISTYELRLNLLDRSEQ